MARQRGWWSVFSLPRQHRSRSWFARCPIAIGWCRGDNREIGSHRLEGWWGTDVAEDAAVTRCGGGRARGWNRRAHPLGRRIVRARAFPLHDATADRSSSLKRIPGAVRDSYRRAPVLRTFAVSLPNGFLVSYDCVFVHRFGTCRQRRRCCRLFYIPDRGSTIKNTC